MSQRVPLAFDSGLSLTGKTTVLLPRPEHDLGSIPTPVHVVQPFKPFHDHFEAQGLRCTATFDQDCENALVFLPRAKAQARALIALANSRCNRIVIVDGAKTDGVDSILKEIRKRVEIHGVLSKAHGKVFWFSARPDGFADWVTAPTHVDPGYLTAPGVFSADGIDPASALLAASLPKKIGKTVVDLGAGWGYLSAEILLRQDVETLDLVEADHTALDCARRNVADPRARFHWADATTWSPRDKVDAVVMNPPFHTSRAADTALGQGFIVSAARALRPSGALWMVANRHLPYEAALQAHFGRVEEKPGDNRFKTFHATRPKR